MTEGVRNGALHLLPRSTQAQRVWQVGGDPPRDTPDPDTTDPDTLRLDVVPDCHENFASLKAILPQLKGLARAEHDREMAKLEGYLREACPDFSAGAGDTHGRFLADSVTLAIMRRISRESVYTARVIETGARLINAIVSRATSYTRVYVPHVDRLDRPTVKVLARAMLLLDRSDRFSWIWQLSGDPTRTSDESSDLYVVSRQELLRKLIGILRPSLVWQGGASAFARPATGGGRSPIDIASALVVQNYDACFLWADDLLRSGDRADVVEALRLRALAAVNVGLVDEACRDLHDAELTASLPGRRAHLCYLQGLIDAKRRYSLAESTAHYERGLVYLDGASAETCDGEDLPLERGWLFNGLALNEAIALRRGGDTDHQTRALALEQQAFALVHDGADPARGYLRFNLLANCALLMEMQGQYDVAIDIFTRTFDFTQDESPAIRRRSRRSLGYRAGVLHYRAGRVTQAHRMLRDAAEQDTALDNWATQERILRALGSVALVEGDLTEAAEVFTNGLVLCRAARSAEGVREHGRGLYAALARSSQEARARALADELALEERVQILSEAGDGRDHDRHAGDVAVQPPSPKLPAYIPEIDLEGIPAIDINRFLGDALGADARTVEPWSLAT